MVCVPQLRAGPARQRRPLTASGPTRRGRRGWGWGWSVGLAVAAGVGLGGGLGRLRDGRLLGHGRGGALLRAGLPPPGLGLRLARRRPGRLLLRRRGRGPRAADGHDKPEEGLAVAVGRRDSYGLVRGPVADADVAIVVRERRRRGQQLAEERGG